MLKAFEAATGVAVPYQVLPRRSGDIAQCWADATKAAQDLGWTAHRGLAQMMQDTWRWQSNNPNGYAK